MHRGRNTLLLPLLLLLLLGGCARVFRVPSPVLYGGENDPFGNGERSNTVQVFYATARNPVPGAEPAKRYGSKIMPTLRIGTATVRFGDEETNWEEVRKATAGGDGLRASISAVHEYGELWTTLPEGKRAKEGVRKPAQDLVAAIDRQLAGSRLPDIFLFLPGFNTYFEWPVTIAGQVRHYTGRGGVALAYCWPCRGTATTYPSDLQTAREGAGHLRELFVLLASRTRVRRIHVLAYSFGPVIIDSVLEDLRREVPDKIGTIVYAAADEDLPRFRKLFLQARPRERFTVYTTETDRGLGLTRSLYQKHPRLGRSATDLTGEDLATLRAEQRSAFIDVTSACLAKGGGFLGHQYFHQNGWVFTDVLLASFAWLPPGERGLVRGKGKALWTFPDDYPERVRKIARQKKLFGR